jgi:hypothetical protein
MSLKNIRTAYVIALALCSGCAASGPKVRDVTELAPPENVRLVIEPDRTMLVWDASYHEISPEFAGYNLYISDKSLILAPWQQLPVPVALDKQVYQYPLDDLEPEKQYFIHLRCRNQKGEISLPTLPEVVVGKNEK